MMWFVLPPLAFAQSKQLELACPPALDQYCGGWTVTQFSFFEDADEDGDEDDHLKVSHSFVIGQKGPKVWLFPRGELREQERWGHSVELDPVVDENFGTVLCLIGEVRLIQGHGNAGQRHKVVVTTDVQKTGPEIGWEHELRLRLFDPTSTWKTSCDPLDSEARHAGTAHAQD
jgi:hypothetical protein